MPRRIIYGISFWAFLAAAACTIAAIALPNWITYTVSSSDGNELRVSYGLHKRCSTLTGQCSPYPTQEDCQGNDGAYFCAMWRSTGFFMNFTVVLQLAVVVAYVTILVGGRQTREGGWKLVSGLLAFVAAGQIIAMALVAYLFNNYPRFSYHGWALDRSWVLCTVSWSILVINAVSIAGAGLFGGSEDDYEPISD